MDGGGPSTKTTHSLDIDFVLRIVSKSTTTQPNKADTPCEVRLG
jgi:hypothetical protein